MFGLGPVPAVQQAVQRAQWKLSDVERVEINEAFAAHPLEVLRELALSDFHHRPVLGMYCKSYRHLMRLEKRLREHGVDVYEADVRPTDRYLMERFITAPVLFTGTPSPDDPRLFVNAQLKPDHGYRPKLRPVSLDIETTMQGELRSIALEGCGQRQVYMLGPENGTPASRALVDFELEYRDTRAQLLDAMEELRNAGAEAMQVEGAGESGTTAAVRVVASTSFVDDKDGVAVDGTRLSSPYRFVVIGDPATRAGALAIPGGVADSVRRQGGATGGRGSAGAGG